MKTVIVESCTAVITATVNVGTEEISKLLIEEIANTHFVQYFENWIKEDSAYRQKTISIENKLNALYNKFGITIAKQSIDTCIESSLEQMISGGLGDKVFSQISRVVGGITKGLSMAAKSLGKGNSKAKLLGSIASIVDKTVKVAEFSKNFAQLCNISNDFYDHLIIELNKVEASLIEQQKNGALKIDEKQIAEEKVHCSFSGEASKDVRRTQEKMHVAFKSKIKNGFLQPAVGSLLHMAVKPIQQMITVPFTNAMDQLKEHIDSRAEMFQIAIMNQRADRVLPITARQKKALELRGEIIKIENIKVPSFLKAEVTNFAGETLENLQKEHGSNLNVMIKDGKIYAVLPTYKQLCNSIQNSNLKLAGELHIKMAATQVGREIEVVSANIDDSKTLIHHEKGPGIVKPIGDSKSKKESYKIAFIEGENGEAGHYAPVIKDQDGNWKVIRDIGQTVEKKDACFGQTMAFLKEYEKNGNLEEAKLHAENPEKVTQYNKSLGKFAKHNKEIKAHYLQGTTVQSNRIVGGVESNVSRIERILKEKYSELDPRISDILEEIKATPKKSTKKLLRVILANELFAKVPCLPQECREKIKLLAAHYNDNISPIIPYTLEFSQDYINANFAADTKGTGFPHAGKSVLEVGKSKPFPAQDFVIEVFLHPSKERVLVINNNRGATAHAIAEVPISKIKLIDYDKASNKNAFSKRGSDGLTIQFDKNTTSRSKFSMMDWTKIFRRYSTSVYLDSIDQSSHSGLQGVGLRNAVNIGSINAYFGEYTLNAIENILELRVNDVGLNNVSIARDCVFQEHYNNLQRMIDDLIDTKSRIILTPLNLYNKHAGGIMGIKNQDNELKLYYIDPSNEVIPDKLKQIFIAHDLHIEQLPAEQQKYANCGPEVIENFMLYLTGDRLSQEESITYHSQLIEQKLVSKANNLGEVIDSRYSSNLEELNSSYDNDDSEKVDQGEVPLDSVDIDIKVVQNIPYLIKHSVPTSQTINFKKSCKDKNYDTDSNDTIREQNAFYAYSQGNILSNEAWEAESDGYNDRSVEAEQKFAKSLQLYQEAVELSPTNVAYKHALDITSLKIGHC